MKYPGWFENLKPLRNAPGVRNAYKQDPNNPNMQGHYQMGFDGRALGMWRGPHQISGRPGCLAKMEDSYKLFLASRRLVNVPDAPPGVGSPRPSDWFAITAYSRPIDQPETGWAGRSQIWIGPGEMAQLADKSADPESPFWMPRGFVMRVIMMGLSDNTFAWVREWRSEDVRKAQVSARGLKTVGNIRTVVFGGDISLRHDGELIGFDCAIKGELDIDLTTKRITRFRGYAQGPAWGAPLNDDGTVRKTRARLGIALLETTDETVINLNMGNDIYANGGDMSSLIP